MCKFIPYWSLESVTLKKVLIITGTTNWNWIKFGAGFCSFYNGFYPQKPSGFFWVLPRCLNPGDEGNDNRDVVLRQSWDIAKIWNKIIDLGLGLKNVKNDKIIPCRLITKKFETKIFYSGQNFLITNNGRPALQ